MRIVHIADCYLPRLGGIEVQVDGLARAQQAAGHEVHIITATRLEVRQPEVVDGVQIHRRDFPMPADLPLHPRALAVIARSLREISPDVVHVHVGSVSVFSWSGIRAARRLGLPVVTTVHSMWGPVARRLFWFANVMTRWSTWTVLTAVSTAAAMPVARAASLKADEVLITTNGVDLEGWRPSSEPRVPNGVLKLVSATRFAPRKRVLPLIEMLGQLHEILGENCPSLTIAGSGPALDRARARVHKLGLDGHIKLVGRVDREELGILYASSDVFIQLSVRESFGLAAIEARASGLPIIGRADNGFREFVTPGVDGYLEPTDAMVKARLVEIVQQPQLLEGMRSYAATHRPKNTWEYALQQVQRSYEVAQSHRLR